MRQQYVYKLSKQQWQSVTNDKVVLIDSISTLLSHIRLLRQVMSTKDICKAFIKVLSNKRAFTIFTEDKKISAWLVITFGYCGHYPIEANDAVIGPVNTEEHAQGKGLGTLLMQGSLAYCFKNRKQRAVFIDTAEDNWAMQRVIQKCNFGDPISQYDRKD